MRRSILHGKAAETAPIVEVDGGLLGGGEAGDVTRKLVSLYGEVLLGKRGKYRYWITEA